MSVTASELDRKSQWLCRCLRLNGFVFRNECDDMQIPALNPQAQQKTLDAGSATIEGIELQPTLLLADGLIVRAGYSNADAKYTSFRNAPVLNPSRATDLELVKVPRHLASMYGQYEGAMQGDLGRINLFTSPYLAPLRQYGLRVELKS